jgi:hypothetical protein
MGRADETQVLARKRVAELDESLRESYRWIGSVVIEGNGRKLVLYLQCKE